MTQAWSTSSLPYTRPGRSLFGPERATSVFPETSKIQVEEGAYIVGGEAELSAFLHVVSLHERARAGARVHNHFSHTVTAFRLFRRKPEPQSMSSLLREQVPRNCAHVSQPLCNFSEVIDCLMSSTVRLRPSASWENPFLHTGNETDDSI